MHIMLIPNGILQELVSDIQMQNHIWNPRQNDDPKASRSCRQCGTNFKPKRYWQAFCTRGCREDWHRTEISTALKKHRGE